MTGRILFSFAICVTVLTVCQCEENFYSYSVVDIDGNTVSLEKYRGKITLVVNVASECGFTAGHYKGMVRLQDIFGGTGKFQVLAFPCNQFGSQEPKPNHEIQKWADETYHINFPIFSKINVINEDVPEAWQFLIEKSKREQPSWNFFKYLVSADGSEVLGSWGPWDDIEEIFPVVKDALDNTIKGDATHRSVKSKKQKYMKREPSMLYVPPKPTPIQNVVKDNQYVDISNQDVDQTNQKPDNQNIADSNQNVDISNKNVDKSEQNTDGSDQNVEQCGPDVEKSDEQDLEPKHADTYSPKRSNTPANTKDSPTRTVEPKAQNTESDRRPKTKYLPKAPNANKPKHVPKAQTAENVKRSEPLKLKPVRQFRKPPSAAPPPKEQTVHHMGLQHQDL